MVEVQGEDAPLDRQRSTESIHSATASIDSVEKCFSHSVCFEVEMVYEWSRVLDRDTVIVTHSQTGTNLSMFSYVIVRVS